jgi:hypothetical protein
MPNSGAKSLIIFTSVASPGHLIETVTVRLSLNCVIGGFFFWGGGGFIHLIQRAELVSGEMSVTILHSS